MPGLLSFLSGQDVVTGIFILFENKDTYDKEKFEDHVDELEQTLEEIRAAGYSGGYTQVKEYVRLVRPRPIWELRRGFTGR